MNPLYLASGSPRRRELLTQIGVPFTVVSAPIDESPLPDESALAYVERLARAKAAAGLASVQGPAVVLGADTAVVLDGRILGKPENREDALAMLADLSGREHQVLTAVALSNGLLMQSLFVTGLSGSYSAVVGLPLSETAELLGTFGIACWQSPVHTPEVTHPR